MLPLLQLGAALLQGKKADDEARKQNQISAYMGEAPTAETGNTGKALTGALPGLLGGLGGGGDAGYAGGAGKFDTGNARYDDRTPQMGSALSKGTNSLLDDTFGSLGDNDGDELL